jgi:hypothetical protein
MSILRKFKNGLQEGRAPKRFFGFLSDTWSSPQVAHGLIDPSNMYRIYKIVDSSLPVQSLFFLLSRNHLLLPEIGGTAGSLDAAEAGGRRPGRRASVMEAGIKRRWWTTRESRGIPQTRAPAGLHPILLSPPVPLVFTAYILFSRALGFQQLHRRAIWPPRSRCPSLPVLFLSSHGCVLTSSSAFASGCPFPPAPCRPLRSDSRTCCHSATSYSRL